MRIARVQAIQILDSRGTPTLEVRLQAESGESAKYSVPSGASKGKNEAIELRDNDRPYQGQGVENATVLINDVLGRQITQADFGDHSAFDQWLNSIDPSTQKNEVGGNTTLALSGAFVSLLAKVNKQPLWKYFQKVASTKPAFPHIFANLVNGGKHAPGLDIQEFMIVPKTTKPSEAISQIYDFHHALRKKLVAEFGPIAKLAGDEGGMAPVGAKTEDILRLMSESRQNLSDTALALDVAGSSFYNNGMYNFENQQLSPLDWSAQLSGLASKYHITSLEDPFAETDVESFISYKNLHPDCLIVGDDITVTDPDRISSLAKKKAIGAVIIKPNQIGTISKTIEAIKTARANRLSVIISHRSGETNNSLIIDLAYGFGADGVKIGAPCRGERVAKYNRLLEIEKGI